MIVSARCDCWGYSEIAKSVSEAIFIAGGLALTVDRYVKLKLVHEIVSDVSTALMGYGLPDKVQGAIRKLMSTEIVLNDLTYRYRLCDDGVLEVQFDYFVENYTNDNKDYQFTGRFSKEEAVPIRLEVGLSSTDTSVNGQQKELLIEDKGDAWTYQDEPVAIRPKDDGFTYQIHGTLLVRPLTNSDVIAFARPTIGVKVWAERSSGYVFKSESIAKTTTEGQNPWVYNRLFVPGEHLRFTWSRVPQSAAAGPQSPPAPPT